MSPLEIKVLLNIYAIADWRPNESPAEQEAVSYFIRNGLIQHADHAGYTTTPRGQAHVKQLCAIAWPTEAWVGADGKVIEI